MDIMKLSTVHRNLGADGGLGKNMGASAVKPPGSAIPAKLESNMIFGGDSDCISYILQFL